MLCPTCLGENDDGYRFCQACGEAVPTDDPPSRDPPLRIDEQAITRRYAQFSSAWAQKASSRSRSATWTLFSRFLESRSPRKTNCIERTQPSDVVDFLCWLDSCGSRRRTVVHARHCSAVGTKDLSACSTRAGECNLRYAHDSLRTNHVSKLSMVFEKELGITSPWSSSLRIGNPVRSDLVSRYMAFTTAEQKKAGVLVQQAPTILRSHLATILTPMRTRLPRQWTASFLREIWHFSPSRSALQNAGPS